MNLNGPDVLANVVGGIVAAIFIAFFTGLRSLYKQCVLKKLIKIMGLAIEHRNIGKSRSYANEEDWVRQAKFIEEEAIKIAKLLSPTAGSLVEWLDRVPPWKSNSQSERYVSILSTIIIRI